ncbi:hypothetical protein MBLNU459_g7864t1 [Dothideomycetes sp. NU459]
MPTLKQVSCSIELQGTNVPLEEYGTRYGDGHVEAFVSVPTEEVGFSIHLTSERYIAPGLAMFVYIDGQYQCNRNRRGLVIPEKDTPPNHYQVDLRVRQKEDKQPNVSADSAPDINPDVVKNIGTIEVVVLRCKAGPQHSDPRPASDVSGHGTKLAPGTKGDNLLGAMFDGPAEYERYGTDPRLRSASADAWQPRSGYPIVGLESDPFGGLPQVQTIMSDPAEDPEVWMDDPYAGLSAEERREIKGILKQQSQAVSESDVATGPAQVGDKGQSSEVPSFSRHVSFTEQPAKPSDRWPPTTADYSTSPDYQPKGSRLNQDLYGIPGQCGDVYSQPTSHHNTHHQAPTSPNSMSEIPPWTPDTPLHYPYPYMAYPYERMPKNSALFTNYHPDAHTYKPSKPDSDNLYGAHKDRFPSTSYSRAYGRAEGSNTQRNTGQPKDHEKANDNTKPYNIKDDADSWHSYGANQSESSRRSRTTSGTKDSTDLWKGHESIDWAKQYDKNATSKKANGWFCNGSLTSQAPSWDRPPSVAPDGSKYIRKKESSNGWDDAQKTPSRDGNTQHAWGQSGADKDGQNEKPVRQEWSSDRNRWDNDKQSSTKKPKDKDWNNKQGSVKDATQDTGWKDRTWGSEEQSSVKKSPQERGWNSNASKKQGCVKSVTQERGWGSNGNNKQGSVKSASSVKSAAQGAGWSNNKQGSIKDGGHNNWNKGSQEKVNHADGWGDANQQNDNNYARSKASSRSRQAPTPAASVVASSKAGESIRSRAASPGIQPKIKPYWATWKEPMSVIIETPEEKFAKAHDPFIAPEEPLVPITAEVVKKQNVQHQVKRGRGAAYTHLCAKPEYLDEMDHPYAVFTFKYRSKEVIEKMFKTKVKENGEDVIRAKLATMGREQLAEELLKLKMQTRIQAKPPATSGRAASSIVKVDAWNNSVPAGSVHNTERSSRSSKGKQPASEPAGWGNNAGGSATGGGADGGWGNAGANNQAQGNGWGGSNKASEAEPTGNW